MAVAFTDEKIRIIDFRVKPASKDDISTIVLEGEHTDLIKKIQISPDGTELFSAGSDCVVKLWDLGMRRCI